MPESEFNPFVSRGGPKLAAALGHFKIDVAGWTCVDLGCNVGGFTDCLLQRGAARVVAVDTAYGELAWKLRQDERVEVLERTNAMHLDPRPVLERVGRVDLVVIDLGWTAQRHAIPSALRWRAGRIITLIKPQYEVPKAGKGAPVLEDAEAEAVARRVVEAMAELGVGVEGWIPSPIRGGGSRGGGGNREFLALVTPLETCR